MVSMINALCLLAFLAALSTTTQAAPSLTRRAADNNDVNILNFALTLELLESSFYVEGLRLFPESEMRRAGIENAKDTFKNIFHIAEHEQAHVNTLTTVIKSLGGRPVSQCEFAFHLPDVRSFVTTARILEKVGVSAYTGALAKLKDPKLQTAGATIGTTEGRHSAFLNLLSNLDPAAEDFDVPLDAREVFTLASPFIRKCDVDLGLKPFDALELEDGAAKPGDFVRVKTQLRDTKDVRCNFLFSDQSAVTDFKDGRCQVPREARGDIYLALVRSDKALSLDNTNIIVAGPAIVSVDTFALDSCDVIHGSKNQEVRVDQNPHSGDNNDDRRRQQQQQQQQDDERRRREEEQRKRGGQHNNQYMQGHH
ncbi:hypothetical protein RI367_001318 [Sorochytrium milnesiophthora]